MNVWMIELKFVLLLWCTHIWLDRVQAAKIILLTFFLSRNLLFPRTFLKLNTNSIPHSIYFVIWAKAAVTIYCGKNLDYLVMCFTQWISDYILYLEQFDRYTFTEQKIKFSIKDFFSKCDQIRRKLRI